MEQEESAKPHIILRNLAGSPLHFQCCRNALPLIFLHALLETVEVFSAAYAGASLVFSDANG